MRYTLTHLHDEIERFKVTRLLIVGVAGAIELQRDMLPQVLRDGFANMVQITPHSISPWLLSVPHTGIGLLTPNPGGRRNRNGTRGRVHMRPPCSYHP
jgi:hypothetical protein